MGHKTAKQIINTVAIECGLAEVASPFSSADAAFIQLRGLLGVVGEELIEAADWQVLRQEHTLTTDSGTYPDGVYPLPSDFRRMIDQTGWQRTDRVPLFGPVSAQQWQYLKGRNLVSNTIYASFRLTEGALYFYPDPPPDGDTIAFEYVSDKWVDTNGGGTYSNTLANDADVPLFNSRLTERALKFRFLQARGFDSTAAGQEYQNSLDKLMGDEKSAPILTAGDGGWPYPYLNGFRNTPDSGFGS